MRSIALSGAFCCLCACQTTPASTAGPSPSAPLVSSTPAQIVLTASTRQDLRLDVTAKVLTTQGTLVANAVVTFSVDNGSITPTSATTDANGLAQAIATSSGKVTISASTGALSTTIAAAGVASSLEVSLGVAPVITGTASSFVTNLFGLPNSVSVTSYSWTFGDGGADQTSAGTNSHTYARNGTYSASVTVTDTLGRTASASASAVVSDPPPPGTQPGPSYSVSVVAVPAAVLVGGSSTLTATVTQNNGAVAPTTYAWDCTGTGAPIITTTVSSQSCTYDSAGTITSKVTVSGGVGATLVSGVGAVAVAVNRSIPVVTISCSTGVHLTGASVCVVSAALNGSPVASTNISHVDWDFGDGSAATTLSNVSPSHTYLSANTFTVVGSNVLVTGATGPGSGSTTTTILP